MVQLLRSDRAQVTPPASPTHTGPPAAGGDPHAGGWLTRWNIAAGHFFFKYRNAVFPAVIAVTVLALRPGVILSPTADAWLVRCGAVLALIGQAVRLGTIGFEYIERGGKEGKVYASRLVTGGIYAHTRNPMYVGNSLIAIGISMYVGAPVAYLAILPLFLFIYQAIVSAEEAYLRRRFGREYDAYCAAVPRFLPALGGIRLTLTSGRYSWKRAVRQDLSTFVALLLGLTLLPVWRTFFLDGLAAARRLLPRSLVLTALILAGYGFGIWLKKTKRLLTD